ncbi:SDR family NAD(P)-dependent oxidoreductase [Chlorobium sp.]|uniref:SDR family NAD(P)-dependent oxidoreductase n=1 Tax=Chlorobium sp. TaxID=1095 RepID=UPI003C5574EE
MEMMTPGRKGPLLPVALVTGASSGIGRALAGAFAGMGNHLLLVARSADRLAGLSRELQAAHGVSVFCCPADLAQQESPQRIFDYCTSHHLSVRLLVNCAGTSRASDFSDLAFEDIERIMQVNMSAAARLARLFIPGMAAERDGAVINIASLGGLQGVPGLGLYSATKSFMITLGEALHMELRGTGVKVVTVCPGFVDTGFMESSGHDRRGVRLPVRSVDVVVRAVLRGYRQNRMRVYPTILDFLVIFSQRFVSRHFSVRLSGYLAAARNNR